MHFNQGIMEFNDKQVQIIKTAEQLFASKGFDGTSVRDIADEAGINVAMISYYFGSKEKLMEAIFHLRVGNIKMRVASLINDDTLSPIQKVNMLIDEHIDRVIEKECFFKIMVTEQLLNKNQTLLNSVKGLKIKNAEIIGELIKDGQKKGVFKKKVDVVLMLNTMVGTVWQTMMSKAYYREFNKMEDMTDDDFNSLIKRKLSIHIKKLFKDILTNEA